MKSLGMWVQEYCTGWWIGPASEELQDLWKEARKKGNAYIQYPHNPYKLEVVVEERFD